MTPFYKQGQLDALRDLGVVKQADTPPGWDPSQTPQRQAESSHQVMAPLNDGESVWTDHDRRMQTQQFEEPSFTG